MAKKFQNQYPDYGRMKFKVFKKQVEKCFNDLAEAANQMEIEEEAPKSENSSKSKKAAGVVISSSSGSEDEDAKASKVAGKGMNKTMSDLYSSSNKSDKTTSDFEKIKTSANQAEKKLKSSEKEAEKKTEPLSKSNDDEKKTDGADLKNGIQMIDLEEEPSKQEPKPKEIPPPTPSASHNTSTGDKKPRAASPTPLKIARKRKLETAFKEAKVRFHDIGGMEDTLDDLMTSIFDLRFADPEDDKVSRSLLLHGPIGVGKTLLANCIAGQLGWPMLEVISSEIVSGVSGESEAKIKSLFDQAFQSGQPCVIFMDELESIGQKSDNSRGMDHRIISQLKSCLDSIQNSQVLFIAATNSLERLDMGLRSKFSEISIPVPNEQERQKIIEKITLNDKMLGDDFDPAVMARLTPGFVGKDIVDLSKKARKVAIKKCLSDLTENKKDLDSYEKAFVKCQSENFKLNNLKIGMNDFKSALKTVQPIAKREGFATVPDVTWKDVGALKDIRQEIELKVMDRVNKPEYAKAMCLDSPTGVLLVGPPGCGKTLVAKAVANQAGINFISVKGPELLNMVRFLLE